MTKLDSTKAFQYLWYTWSLIGVHPFKTHQRLFKVYSIFVTLSITLLSPLQLIAQGFFADSFAKLMRNMSTSIELTCCSLKIVFLFIYRRQLLRCHEFLTELDSRVDETLEDRKYMDLVVRNCRRIFFIYQILFWMTVTTYGASAAFGRRLMLEGWLPFDWQSSTKLYATAFAYQLVNASYQCMTNLTTDIYPVLYIYVILGHMKCLGKRIASTGYGEAVKTAHENYSELIRCVNDHRNTLDYFCNLSPIISATIFIQFIVTAFVLCITALCLQFFTDDFTFLLTSFCYLLSILIEVLPCCYLVSEISEASINLTTAVYSCNWMDQNLKFRKALIIFMQGTQKPITIMAGNMIPISLPTFIGLLRVSFSIYTLLSSL